MRTPTKGETILRSPAGSWPAQIEARDAALLVLGWAAALRRSELVGLDRHELGPAPVTCRSSSAAWS